MGTEEPRLDHHNDGMSSSEQWTFSPFTRRAATVIALGAVVTLGAVLIWQLFNLLLVIFAGVLLAVFLRGLTNFLAEKTPLSPNWAFFCVLASVILLSAGTVALLAPPVVDQLSEIGQKLPQAVEQLRSWFEGTAIGGAIMGELPSLDELASAERIGWTQITGAFSSVVGALTNIVFIIFLGVYLAVDPALYKRGIVRLVPLHYRPRAGQILDALSHQLGWWLVGRLLSMLAVAILTTVSLWILGIPLALVLGLISGLLSFVPIVGPLVSFVPAGLIALLEGPEYVLYTAFIYMGVQAMEGYFITPLIQERTVSLPAALLLAAEVIAGLLFGIMGIVVATPLAVLFLALINLVYVEDVLGDRTSYSDKIPGSDDGRERLAVGRDKVSDDGAGDEPSPPGTEPSPA